MPRSTTPAGSSCLAMRTSQRGELLLPTTFVCDLGRCRCLIPHCLVVSPPRGTSMLPPLFETTRAPATSKLSGLNHAASALAVYASQPASRRTTQDSLAAGGQPLLRGIGYPPGYFQGFSTYMASSSAKLAWRNSNSNLESAVANRIRGPRELRRGAATTRPVVTGRELSAV
jgi:hypothetical protein